MWDHKSGNSISAIEEANKSGSTELQQDKKFPFQSSEGQDSGFLSGQNLSSSDIDYDIEEIKETNIKAEIVVTAKQIDKSYTDSGAIDDDYEDDCQETAAAVLAKDNLKQQSQKMIIDSGVDLGLEEWFCGLNLKNSNQQLNNLGSACRLKEQQQQQKYPRITKKLQQIPLWQMCYVQDDDGDT